MFPTTKTSSLDEDRFESNLQWKVEIELGKNEGNLSDIFFGDVFPCIKGHTQLINDHYSSNFPPYYDIVRHNKIKFHNKDSNDP